MSGQLINFDLIKQRTFRGQCWVVERWGGKPQHPRHVAFIGSEAAALERFTALCQRVRQGTVNLVAPDGSTAKRYEARR